MGLRGIPECEVIFEDLEVPEEMALRRPSGALCGFSELMNAYNSQRVGAATVALGIARGAFEAAVAYAKERRQFGRPVAEFQGLQWMMADMAIRLNAARLGIRRGGRLADPFPDPLLAAGAKVFAAELAIQVTNDALQMFGARGYSRRCPMERMVRDARMFTIGGGTAQVLRNSSPARRWDGNCHNSARRGVARAIHAVGGYPARPTRRRGVGDPAASPLTPAVSTPQLVCWSWSGSAGPPRRGAGIADGVRTCRVVLFLPRSKEGVWQWRCLPMHSIRCRPFSRRSNSFRSSDWLASGPSSGGAYPPMNVFRKGDDFVIIAELPGVRRQDLDVQVKDNTVRVAGRKNVAYPEKAAVHRRERASGQFDRAVTLPVQIDTDNVKAEYRDGVLALLLPRAERDKPKTIQIA